MCNKAAFISIDVDNARYKTRPFLDLLNLKQKVYGFGSRMLSLVLKCPRETDSIEHFDRELRVCQINFTIFIISF